MKKSVTALVLLGLFWVTPLFGYNLTYDPSLEVDADLDGMPDAWMPINNYPNDYALEPGIAFSGNQSLSLHTYNAPGGGLISGGGLYQWVDVEPDTAYRMSYRVRTEDAAYVEAHPIVAEFDAGGTRVSRHYSYIAVDEDLIWTYVAYDFTTTSTTEQLRGDWIVRSYFDQTVDEWRTGEYRASWIDDLKLETVTTPLTGIWLWLPLGWSFLMRRA